MGRCIVHLDMDAFYASIEERDRPELAGRPVAVGGQSRRAVVAAASYAARRFGVRSAMPVALARRLCADLVVVPLRMDRYREVSRQIRDLLERHTALIEPLALDEFYLDVSEPAASVAEAGRMAEVMRAEIRGETGLTASAGVGPNKLVAKIASGLDKPNALVVVEAEAVAAFLAPLPVSKVWGVGVVTGARLEALGIRTIADLAAADVGALERTFGKLGPRLHGFAHGIDERPVNAERQAKSVSNETTFEEDTTDLEVLHQTIERLAQRVAERLDRRGLQGRTVILKLTYRGFAHASRHASLPEATHDARVIAAEAAKLLTRTDAPARPVRLVGVGVTSLSGAVGASPSQLGFFG